MYALYALVLVSYVFYFVFATLCLACGLYYVAELIEEYSVWAKKTIRRTVLTILAIHVALALFEDLPFTYLLLSAVTHLCLLSLLPAFPAIYLTEPRFILSGVLSIFNHCVWFYHFTSVYYPFPQILAFFSLCVWLCPFLFFISLSANEYTLPSSVITSTGDSDVPSAKKRSSWFLSLFATLRRQQEEIMPGMFGVSSNTKLT